MSKIQNDLVAKLLANEDITVFRESTPTASFDIKSRVLRLPMWEGFSDDVEQMLIAHEISHALFTTEKYLTLIEEVVTFRGGGAYMNILEDARIEKLIKRKYPGLRKVFRLGYDELKEKNFFGSEKDLEKHDHLMDRINLYFKLGFDSVKFSEPEMVFVRRAEALETLDEVAALAVDIYNFLRTNSVPNSSFDEVGDLDSDVGSGDSIPTNIDDEDAQAGPNVGSGAGSDSKSEDSPQDKKSNLAAPGKMSGASKSDYFEPGVPESNDVLTKNLAKAINGKKLIDYVKIDQYPPNIIVPYTKVLDYFKQLQQIDLQSSRFAKLIELTSNNVAYMVKEFEMKKAASEFKRAQISKTGILDVKKLYSYQINDDLFKRVTIRKTGKNHGMVMLLDWSGSMQGVLQDTIDQLINLVMFCQRVQIPFEVYIFGASTQTSSLKNEDNNYHPKPGTIPFNQSEQLIEIFSSRMRADEFKMMGSLLKSGTFAKHISLGNTPLNAALAVMYNYLGVFRDSHKVEKLTLITLTDGGSHVLPRYIPPKRWPSYQYGVDLRYFAIEERTKKSFELTNHTVNTTVQLHAMIKARYKCSMITFHILENGANYSIERAVSTHAPMDNGRCYIPNSSASMISVSHSIKSDIEKNKFSVFNDGVRDAVFLIPRNHIKINEDNASMEKINSSSTPRGIASAFTKTQQSKKQSRILLRKFIDSIA